RPTDQLVRSSKAVGSKILTPDAEPVPTTIFMKPDNAGISAIIGYSSDRSKTPLLTADVVHNHLADQPIELGLLGPDNTEWGKVSETGQEIEIGKLTKAFVASDIHLPTAS